MSNMDEEYIDRISQLPTDILRDILFNLSLKDEARTCVLSKSWNTGVWSSLPQRTFDFMRDGAILMSGYTKEEQQEFIDSVESSFQKLHSERFIISAFNITLEVLNEQNVSYVDRWLELAVKNSLRRLCLHNSSSSKITQKYKVPAEIALASLVPLKELELAGCWLYKNSLWACNDVVGPLALKRLCFVNVSIDYAYGDFQKFISRCTSLEYLRMDDFHGVKYLQLVNLSKLKELVVNVKRLRYPTRLRYPPPDRRLVRVDVDSLTLQTLRIDGVPLVVNFTRCRNLQHLYISCTTIEDQFLQNLAINFPLLRTFTLYECYGLASPSVIRHPQLLTLQLLNVSTSVELLNISTSVDLVVDTPNLLSLEHNDSTFRVALFLSDGSSNSSLVRKFCLYLTIVSPICTKWFVQFKAYLAQLQGNNVNVNFNVGLVIDACMREFDVDITREGLPLACNVRYLRVDLRQSLESATSFFDGLFWICRPMKLYVKQIDGPRKELLKVIRDMVLTTRGDSACCKSCHVKCWHHSVKVNTINGTDTADTSLVESVLQNQSGCEEIVLTLGWI